MGQLTFFDDKQKQQLYDVKLEPNVNKEYILSRVTQEEIFEHYLNIKVQTNKHFCSPLRVDKNPTCTFSWYNSTLYFRDWADDKPLDCWNLVMKMYGLSFHDALKKITYDLDLSNRDPNIKLKNKYKEQKKTKKENKNNKRTRIQVSKQPFTTVDKKYLSKYNINKKICRYFGCYSISKLWLNGNPIYNYQSSDPALGYYFGKVNNVQLWKIYFYSRDTYRFICNTNIIQGWKQLPIMGAYCIITKSMKDVMSLSSFGISSIAPQNETQLIEEKKINRLKAKFDKLFTLYDFDRAGISGASKLYKHYNIPFLFFTNGRFNTVDYGVKDFSDYVEKYGVSKTQDLINKVRNYYE